MHPLVKKSTLAAASLTLAFGLFGGTSAMAATSSGSLNCSAGGAKIAVTMKQQRLGTMKSTVNGALLQQVTGTYTASKVSRVSTGSWAATSETLLFSGTNGFCSGNVG